MAKKQTNESTPSRRSFTKEFKQQAVQMLVEGHSAKSIAANLGIGNTNLIYRWKSELIANGAAVTEALDDEVRQLREQLRRTQRERDILKKALAILSQQE